MSSWTFGVRSGFMKQRDPVQGEFFNSEALTGVASALVRESGQNTLDARESGPARVRVFVSGSEGALSAAEADAYLGTLWPHLSA